MIQYKTLAKYHPSNKIKTIYLNIARFQSNTKENSSTEKTFTFFSCIRSCLRFKGQKDDPYRKSRKLLNEYIDLKKIIQRLQDLDKLKNILLYDSQRFFFDQIPKPEISIGNKKKCRHSISESNILKAKLKRMTNEKILENYERLCKEHNEIDKRICSMLDEKTSKNLNLNHLTIGNYFILLLL